MNRAFRGNMYMLFIILTELFFSAAFGLAIIYFKISLSPALVLIITQLTCFLFPLIIYLAATRSKITDIASFKPLNKTNIIMIIFMSVCIQPAMSFLSAFSMIFFENNVSYVLRDMYKIPLPMLITSLAVAPAIFEELTLRGVILKNYKHFPIGKAAVVNGLFFGIMHLDPQQFLYAFLMGIVFSYFVYYTGSIFSSMLAHFTINLSQSLLVYIVYGSMEELAASIPQEPLTAYDLINAGISLVVLSAIFMPVFLILFRTFITYNKHRNIIEQLSDPNEPIPEEEPPIQRKRIVDWAFCAVIIVYLLYIIGTLVAN